MAGFDLIITLSGSKISANVKNTPGSNKSLELDFDGLKSR